MGLLKFLESSKEARKIFGQRELKIIEKQLKGINLTQSEKNRLSRDIRKKLKFMRDISRFEEEFDLKKGLENKKLIEEAKEVILEHPLRKRIKKIILFGSVVKNEVTIRSDIDIVVDFSKITKKEAFDFRKEVMGELPDKVDIQVFNILPDKIKRSILKNHRVLYNNG
ncbi:MAG: nucleotidyltransferase domain-containing protein [archaeon]